MSMIVDALEPQGAFVAGLSWLQKERIIADEIEDMLQVQYDLPSLADRELFVVEFNKFANWAESQGLLFLPASGHVVGAYVLDRLFDDASLNDIADAVASVKLAHEMARQYLDWAPIDAALEFAIQEKENS